MPVPETSYGPDPLRDRFISGARVLLDRAYAHPGAWQGTRLADPTAAQLRACLAAGIDPAGPDNVSAAGGRRGGLNARSRWMRAFVRCLYEQHLFWAGTQSGGGGWRPERRLERLRSRALVIEVGRAVPVRGVIPAGRAVRIRVLPPGLRAAERKPEAARIYDSDGGPGTRWSDPGRRDWA